MKVQMSGTRNGEDWPAPGGTIEVSKDESETLFSHGLAVPFEGKADNQAPELAVAVKPETATRKGGLTTANGV